MFQLDTHLFTCSIQYVKYRLWPIIRKELNLNLHSLLRSRCFSLRNSPWIENKNVACGRVTFLTIFIPLVNFAIYGARTSRNLHPVQVKHRGAASNAHLRSDIKHTNGSNLQWNIQDPTFVFPDPVGPTNIRPCLTTVVSYSWMTFFTNSENTKGLVLPKILFVERENCTTIHAKHFINKCTSSSI